MKNSFYYIMQKLSLLLIFLLLMSSFTCENKKYRDKYITVINLTDNDKLFIPSFDFPDNTFLSDYKLILANENAFFVGKTDSAKIGYKPYCNSDVWQHFSNSDSLTLYIFNKLNEQDIVFIDSMKISHEYLITNNCRIRIE